MISSSLEAITELKWQDGRNMQELPDFLLHIEGFHAREQLGDSPVPVDIRGFQHNCTVVKQGMLKGYRAAISNMRCQERYDQKLTLISGEDPYELPQSAWIDDVDAWPAMTYIHIGMYLVYSPSPYTSEALMNYKSLDCYQRFVAGWVNGVYVRVGATDDVRVVTAKV